MKLIGIEIITGEACALSMRLRCGLTPEAMQLYLEYTGIQVDFEQVRKSPYSREEYTAFLTWEVMEDLLIFKLMQMYSAVVEILPNPNNDDSVGFRAKKYLLAGDLDDIRDYTNQHPHLFTKVTYNEETDKWDKTEGLYDVGRTYSIYPSQPRRGFSNVHAFTGVSI